MDSVAHFILNAINASNDKRPGRGSRAALELLTARELTAAIADEEIKNRANLLIAHVAMAIIEVAVANATEGK